MESIYSPIQVGERIALRRHVLRMTQEQLAENMDVSVQMISNLERGEKIIRADNLLRLSKVLGVSCDYILTGHKSAEDVDNLAAQLQKLPDEDFKIIELLVNYLNRRGG